MLAIGSNPIDGGNYRKNMKITSNKTRTLINNRLNNCIQWQIQDMSNKIIRDVHWKIAQSYQQ